MKNKYLYLKTAISTLIFLGFFILQNLYKTISLNSITATKLENSTASYTMPIIIENLWKFGFVFCFIIVFLIFAKDIKKIIFKEAAK